MPLLVVVVVVLLALGAQGQFELKPLPFDLGALEPGVDAATVSVHWGRHHRQYMDNMNSALTTLQSSGLVSSRLVQRGALTRLH